MMQTIIDAILQNQTFALLGHVNPDGDCLGSMLSLNAALKSIGKNSHVILLDKIPSKYSNLPGADSVEIYQENAPYPQVIITLDCATADRLGQCGDYLKANLVINIDHHVSNSAYGHINWMDGGYASTGEMILKLIRALSIKITPEIANCLFVSISTDTGFFAFANSSVKSFSAALEMFEAGADVPCWIRNLFRARSLATTKLVHCLLSSLKLDAQNKIASGYITLKDLQDCGAVEADTEGLIDFLQDIVGVEVAVMARQTAEQTSKISLRSQTIEIESIARQFGGGGHPQAAGCSMPYPSEKARDEMVKIILGQIHF